MNRELYGDRYREDVRKDIVAAEEVEQHYRAKAVDLLRMAVPDAEKAKEYVGIADDYARIILRLRATGRANA